MRYAVSTSPQRVAETGASATLARSVAARLRAERAGNMDERVRTLGYTATDASKNTAGAFNTVSSCTINREQG